MEKRKEFEPRRVIEFSQVLTTVLSGVMVALLISYGSDIKQISVLVYQVQKHDMQIGEIQRKLWSEGK